MILFRISRYGRPEVESVEVERATGKSVWLKRERWGGTKVERYARHSTSEQYFDTWQEAHAALLVRYEERVRSLRVQLDSATGALGNVKGLVPR